MVSWLGGRVTLDHRRWDCAEAELAWQAPYDLVVLTEVGETASTTVRVEGRLAYEGRDQPGALSFVPAGADRLCAYRDTALVYTALWIDPTVYGGLSGCESLPTLPTLINHDDRVVASLLTSLREEIAGWTPPDAVYVEHLIAILALRLAALDRTAPAPRVRGGRLHRAALGRVRDHVEANLGADIALSDLAALLGMPLDTFARRFRSSTGRAPYAYVLERRVARARTLLTTTEMDIASIAATLGFSSQAHMSTTFRRLTGTTPRAYRVRSFS